MKRECFVCGFWLLLEDHHLKMRAEHPLMTKIHNNVITLCQFCHKRVHCRRWSKFAKQTEKQCKLLSDLYHIAPIHFKEMSFEVNISLINMLREIMFDGTLVYELAEEVEPKDEPSMVIEWSDDSPPYEHWERLDSATVQKILEILEAGNRIGLAVVRSLVLEALDKAGILEKSQE